MLAFKKLPVQICIVLIAFMNFSCSHFQEVTIEKSNLPHEDSEYFDVYEDFTRDVEIYSNFATKYHLSATLMSGEFRQAYSKRHKNLYVSEQPSIVESSNQTGFFVTIFSPNMEEADLNDELLWTIKMKKDDQEFKPSLVRRLNHKNRWKPFFINVNKWTREYLILFDTPSTETSKQLVARKNLSLVLANADARIKLAW